MKTSLPLLALALVPALGFTFAGVPDAQAAGEKGAEETIAIEKVDGGHICGPFPNVSWWVNDRAKILRLVKKRYKGDWDTYIASWNRYGGSLQRSLENGEARVIKSQGKTLRGPTLAVHVAMVKKRVAVLTCLRDTENSRNNRDSLETAAGGDHANGPENSPAASRPRQTALVLGKCNPLPQTDWWSKSPGTVKAAVAKNYDGDWDRYIARWNRHYKSMKRSYENGKARGVRSLDITLRGKILQAHVAKIKKRIEVLKCLQKNAEAIESRQASINPDGFPKVVRADGTSAAIPQDGSIEANLETASGAPARTVVRGEQMQLRIEAECIGGQASFKLNNEGGRWPRLAEINIHRMDTKALLVKRRLRMRGSQQMIFRIPRNLQQGIAGVGIFVNPSWFPRKFQYDAVVNCAG